MLAKSNLKPPRLKSRRRRRIQRDVLRSESSTTVGMYPILLHSLESLLVTDSSPSHQLRERHCWSWWQTPNVSISFRALGLSKCNTGLAMLFRDEQTITIQVPEHLCRQIFAKALTLHDPNFLGPDLLCLLLTRLLETGTLHQRSKMSR